MTPANALAVAAPLEAARPVGRIKASVLRWLGVPLKLTNGEFLSAYYGVDDAGNPISVDTALAISTVWACVRLLSQTLATLPLNVYQRGEKRRLASEHPLHYLLHTEPNRNTTAVVFWEAAMASMLLRGAAFVEIKRLGQVVKGLIFLDPARVEQRLEEGEHRYRFRELDGTWRELKRDNLMIIPAFGIDGETGLTPLAHGAQIFGAASSANRSAARIMANGMKASGFVSTEMLLKTEQREALRKQMEGFATGDRVGGTMVLEGGMKYQAITMRPEDVQLLQTRSFNVEEICRFFGVPAHMVAHTTGATSWGSGLEQQTLAFVQYSLMPWMRRIEQEISKALFTESERREYYAEFTLEGLLRGDSKGRAEFYSTALQNGWMTRREVRRLENLPPVDGDDILTVQVNLVPINQLGKQDAKAALAAALAALVNDATPKAPES